MISFGIKYWFIFFLAILVFASGIVALLYYRNKQNGELGKFQVLGLAILRFLSVFGISFLLLSPFVKGLKKSIQQPIVITAWDNSHSLVSETDSMSVLQTFANVKKTLENKVSNRYQLINYTFGEEVELNGETNFSDKRSNYSRLISTIIENHFNENIGALIIAGDGIYNEGKNPGNLASSVNFPIYTVGFGDTTELLDARIQNIVSNRTTFSGNKFPVEIEAGFLKLKNKRLKLSVYLGKNEVASEIISPPNNNYFFSKPFILEAGNAGLKNYSVKIEAAENERNIKNNTGKFVINVLENKQKILILSGSPHPDIGAIKNTLSEQQSYDVSVFTHEPYPVNISDYNLIILNQLPTSSTGFSELIKQAQTQKIPMLFLVGNQTFLPQLNTLAQGVTINPLAGTGEEAQATLNPGFAVFKISNETAEMIPKFPPLIVHFADYDVSEDLPVLLFQKIKNFETNKPLFAAGKINGRKTGFILGEGIWRWRLFDYFLNQNHKHFNEIVNQLVQYLALRENEDNFIVNFEPVYPETDDVKLTAEVYNENYEPVSGAEINIKFINENGDELNFTFDKQNGKYKLNAGNLNTGNYRFEAEVTLGNETFSEKGAFMVTRVDIENIESRANHNLLYNLAVKTGGAFYLPHQITDLTNELLADKKLQPTTFYQEMINELLNLRWLFFVVLLILSVEWFLRKYWGIY